MLSGSITWPSVSGYPILNVRQLRQKTFFIHSNSVWKKLTFDKHKGMFYSIDEMHDKKICFRSKKIKYLKTQTWKIGTIYENIFTYYFAWFFSNAILDAFWSVTISLISLSNRLSNSGVPLSNLNGREPHWKSWCVEKLQSNQTGFSFKTLVLRNPVFFW